VSGGTQPRLSWALAVVDPQRGERERLPLRDKFKQMRIEDLGPTMRLNLAEFRLPVTAPGSGAVYLRMSPDWSLRAHDLPLPRSRQCLWLPHAALMISPTITSCSRPARTGKGGRGGLFTSADDHAVANDSPAGQILRRNSVHQSSVR
jgi:hypothetical protein